jgi:integrase
MVMIAGSLGLRVSEIMGLQWSDFDFENNTVLVQRGVVHGRVGEVKTEYSKDHLPIDSLLVEKLLQAPEAMLPNFGRVAIRKSADGKALPSGKNC